MSNVPNVSSFPFLHVFPAFALCHEINTCEDQDSRQDFLPGKGVLADHDGNERGDDRLHVVVHADCCRADSLQRHRDEQVGEERRPEEDVEDRASSVKSQTSRWKAGASSTCRKVKGTSVSVVKRNIHFIIVTDE